MDDSLLFHLSEWGLIRSVLTHDPWKRLSAYESGDLVRRLLSERHGREPNASKSIEVAAHITQGRQYFEAARGAAALVRPLLLYYGVLSFSRAIILCSDVTRREATLAQAHGLSASLSKEAGEVPSIWIAITEGTFKELSQSTHNVERSLIYGYSRMRTSIIQHGTVDFRADCDRFQLNDVLSRIPDLADIFQVTINQIGSCYPAYVQLHQGVQTDYYLIATRKGLPSIDHVRKVFGLHREMAVAFQDYHHMLGQVRGINFLINQDTSPIDVRDLQLPIKTDSRIFPYIVEPLLEGLNLSTLSLLFIASYAMSMLVRYYPSQWATLAGRGVGDSLAPLLNEAANLIERRFPVLVLEELEQAHPDPHIYRGSVLD